MSDRQHVTTTSANGQWDEVETSGVSKLGVPKRAFMDSAASSPKGISSSMSPSVGSTAGKWKVLPFQSLFQSPHLPHHPYTPKQL